MRLRPPERLQGIILPVEHGIGSDQLEPTGKIVALLRQPVIKPLYHGLDHGLAVGGIHFLRRGHIVGARPRRPFSRTSFRLGGDRLAGELGLILGEALLHQFPPRRIGRGFRQQRSPSLRRRGELTVLLLSDDELETWLDDGSVDLAILFRTSPTPRNGDTYLVETSTYLVSAHGDLLTSRPTVPFSAMDKLPLVLFCRPSSWRNYLEEISAQRGISLNVVLEADSLSLQTHIVAEGRGGAEGAPASLG